MTDGQADKASADGVFNSKFTNFEVLELSTLATTSTINLAGINSVSQVRAGATGGTVTLNNLASGGTFTLTGNSTAATIGVTNAAFNTDVLNIGLAKTAAGIVAYGAITAADVETVNIASADAVSGGSTAAVDTLTLTAGSATKIVVTGNNGLFLTNGNEAVTTFDASGVVANGTADTAALLAVTFVSAKTSGSVSITGGAGNDTLTGVGAVDTIIGGAGADIIGGGAGADVLTGGEGADVITGGAGNDTIDLTETTAAIDAVVFALTATNGIDTITGFAAGTGTTGIDVATLVNLATTAVTSATTAVFATTASTLALTSGATPFVLDSSTATNDIIEIATTLSAFGNLAAPGVVDGTELLKALSSTNVAANSFTTSTAGDDFYLVAYQGGNAYLYQVNDGGFDTSVVAAEIALVGVFNGIAAGAFVTGDFTVGV